MAYPTTSVQYGQTSNDVKTLQQFLITQGYSIPAGATGYFGDQTKTALSQWQQANGISPSTSGFGTNWGPLSMSAAQKASGAVNINQSLQSGGLTLDSSPSVSTNSTQQTSQGVSNISSDYPTMNLNPGMTGDSVKQLQNFLVKLGYMTQDQVNTGYGTYGPQTKAAVAQLQQDYGVDAEGYAGYWGPRTRLYLQQTQGQGGSLQGPYYKQPQNPTSIDNQLQEPYSTMLNIMQQQLDELQRRGQSVNANIDITPERAAEFMKHAEGNLEVFIPYAEKEILPFYQNQLRVAREGFLRGLGYTQQELLQTEKDLERKYQESSKNIAESSAEKGFALSGMRQKEEQQLADITQGQLQSNRRIFGQRGEELAKTFAQKYGTANTPIFNTTGIPKVGDNSFVRNAIDQPLYSLSDETYNGLVGEQEYQQRADLRSRAAELEQAFRTNAANNQNRYLTI